MTKLIIDRKPEPDFMEISITQFAATRQTPVFPEATRWLWVNAKEAAPNPVLEELRVDRGFRQIQTTHNTQTFFRMCGDYSL
jgi:hypothetical protein